MSQPAMRNLAFDQTITRLLSHARGSQSMRTSLVNVSAMTAADANFRSRVLLSVQRALVGEITHQMRFIGVEYSSECIHIIVWHDGLIDERVAGNGGDFDTGAVAQVVADFCWPERGDPQVSFEFVRCDFPQRPDFRGTLVYGRSETSLA